MIYWIYERALIRNLHVLPANICFMLTEKDLRKAPGKLYDVTRWCRDISVNVGKKKKNGETGNTNIAGITFHISTSDPESVTPYLPDIKKIGNIAHLSLHVGDRDESAGEGMAVWVAVGKSGREEIAECIRIMARKGMSPESITEETFERYLTFRYTPDLVIKTGGDHLTDFLIWQSVYSELFFSDVNWRSFRKVDFLRALRDYQARIRRFGK
jgi:undecaprenyl diphosphate synthase